MTTPPPEAGRDVHIDIIRGIAVFGLIWSNLNAGFYRGPASTADAVAQWATSVFSAGKFFTLFSLLFGVGLAMQVARAEASGNPLAMRWLRRMLVLFAIGWLHAILFWPGDILRYYAIAGAVLLLFRGVSNRTTLLVALLALGLAANRESLSVVATRVAGGDVKQALLREEPDEAQQQRRQAMGKASSAGSYADVVRTRTPQQLGEWRRGLSWPAGPLNWIPLWYFGLFLIGLVLGRSKIVERPADHLDAVRRLMAWGLVTGLPLNVYLTSQPAWLNGHWAYWPLAMTARLALSVGYLGGLLWLLQRGAWQHRLGALAPVGRLGLTNYVSQTAFLTFVQLNYGLGLAPRLGWFACVVIAVAFYMLQVAWSNWWVRHFRFGPIEWLWRTLTMGRLIRFRQPQLS